MSQQATTLNFTQQDISGEQTHSHLTTGNVQWVAISGVAHTASGHSPCVVGYNVEVSTDGGSTYQPLWNVEYGTTLSSVASDGSTGASRISIKTGADHTVYALPPLVYLLSNTPNTNLTFRLSRINSKTELDESSNAVLASVTISELQPDR